MFLDLFLEGFRNNHEKNRGMYNKEHIEKTLTQDGVFKFGNTTATYEDGVFYLDGVKQKRFTPIYQAYRKDWKGRE